MSTASQLMAALQPPVLNVHTPRSSFAIVFSSMLDRMTYIKSLNPSYFRPDTDDTLQTLFDKLSKKTASEFNGQRVKSGWAKYSWNGSIWNLDDGKAFPVLLFARVYADDGRVYLESDYTIFVWRQKSSTPDSDSWPVLHIRNPEEPLPAPPEYQNMSFYVFQQKPAGASPRRHPERSMTKKKKSLEPKDDTPQFKKDFERFHNENGVRTIKGSIGPVKEGERLASFKRFFG